MGPKNGYGTRTSGGRSHSAKLIVTSYNSDSLFFQRLEWETVLIQCQPKGGLSDAL